MANKQTTTVITKQVTPGGSRTVTTGNRDWNTGTFGCFEDCKSLVCATFCYPCFIAQLSKRLGEHCCVPFCVPGGTIALRQKLRLMLSIKGTLCNDCLIDVCCHFCSACQMSRELDQAGW